MPQGRNESVPVDPSSAYKSLREGTGQTLLVSRLGDHSNEEPLLIGETKLALDSAEGLIRMETESEGLF